MSTHFLTITPHGPIIARDGRPFGFGQAQRMRSLDWPYPSVMAGSLRTLLGKANGKGFTSEVIRQLQDISVAGPLPMFNSQLYFPAPADILVYEDEDSYDRKVMPLRPVKEYKNSDDLGCNFRIEHLSPVMVSKDVKPAKVPDFWSYQKMCGWLGNATGEDFAAPPDPGNDPHVREEGFLNAPGKDERFHTAINPTTGTVEEGLLFKTVGLDCAIKNRSEIIAMAARVDSNGNFGTIVESLNQYHPLGGERRLAHWDSIRREGKIEGWDVPRDIETALRTTNGNALIRMVLATPAIFEDGWKPGWLDDSLRGAPYDPDDVSQRLNVQLKLVSACIDRWRPVSGWGLEKGKVGAKPIRRLVPAGAVYFFEVTNGNPVDLVQKLWLRSVSDDIQMRKDGFGLALWGVWDYAKTVAEVNKR